MTSDEPPLTAQDPDYDPLADLLRILDLSRADEVPPEHAGAAAEGAVPQAGDVFLGATQPTPHGRVYGGQVVAQSIMAAGLTVAGLDGPPRHVHSLHGYFLRAGDANEPIRFEVERLRDGGSFSARRVHAVQYGRPILSMIFSFQSEADGMEHQIDMPVVPMPEDIPPAVQRLADAPGGAALNWTVRRAIDMRHCEGVLYAEPGPQRVAQQHVWVKAVGDLPDDPLVHTAVLAYASDFTILEAIIRRHGVAWSNPRLRGASLDHAMWFHRPVRMDDWLLYSESSPSASGGRGLGLGHLFTREGRLVASVAQEGMLRLKE